MQGDDRADCAGGASLISATKSGRQAKEVGGPSFRNRLQNKNLFDYLGVFSFSRRRVIANPTVSMIAPRTAGVRWTTSV